jgi:tetratricopeptide (TPR) repeat protein
LKSEADVRHDFRFANYDLRTVWRVGLVHWMAAGVFLCPAHLAAHDSPEHVVEALTVRIKERGPSADLLWRRATEHRALQQLKPAAVDLREAIRLQPSLLAAHADLARVQLQAGELSAALTTLDHALGLAPDEGARAPLRLVRAEVHAARGDAEKALIDCEMAFAATSAPEADWFLQRSQIQQRLGRTVEAAAGLKQGFDQTGNPVLEAEWIDALLDAGQARAALEHIEPQLAESRWQSSWLLRRARARLVLGESTKARGDLHAAVTEINERLNEVRPEPTLLLDRGLAMVLLGDATAARRDLAAARRSGVDAASTWRLETALTAKKQAEKPMERSAGL